MVGTLVLLAAATASADGPDEGDGPEVTIIKTDEVPAEAAPEPSHPPPKPTTDKALRYRSRRPFAALRASYPMLSAGRFAHADFEDVFGPGPATEIDGGFTKPSVGTLLVGIQYVAFGLGAKSPYADLKEVASHDTRLWIGWRTVANPLYVEAGLGYSWLVQSATDSAGSEARFSVRSLMLRCGGGFSRPMLHRRARLLVGLEYSLGIAGEASAITKIGSATMVSTGPLTSRYRGALSPEVAFQLAF